MEASSYDGVLKFATKTVLYQPRRAVISTFLANLMLADFADDSIVIANFGLSTFLAKPRWLKNHHAVSSARSDGKNSHQLSWRIWACPNCMIVDDSRWQCMVIRVQRRVIVKTIIVYRQLPFERGFSLKLHKLQFHRNYLKLAKFFYQITSYADIFFRDERGNCRFVVAPPCFLTYKGTTHLKKRAAVEFILWPGAEFI